MIFLVIRCLMHILVLMAFVLFTMPSFAVNMNGMGEMAEEHSCCDQVTNKACDKNSSCDDSPCGTQCMTHSCVQTQTLHSSILAYVPVSLKTLFAIYNEQFDSFVVYLLKRPPKI